jgi:hypothetical protein
VTVNPSPNAVVHAVVDYAPDPHGWSMVTALQGAIARTLNGARVVSPRSAQWRGDTQQVQQFRGHAGLGAAKIYAPKSSTMNQQNTGQTLASAIFLDRATRGQQ